MMPSCSVTSVGPHFSDKVIPVGLAFPVASTDRPIDSERGVIGGHPKVIGVGSEGVEGLLEGDFDFESEPIDAKDLQGG